MFMFSIMKCMEISFPDKFNHWKKKKKEWKRDGAQAAEICRKY